MTDQKQRVISIEKRTMTDYYRVYVQDDSGKMADIERRAVKILQEAQA